uniref:ATP synthase F0 subunit 8 n=1 Tax=Aplysia kurodai TaxID=6501 RepID=A0A059Q4R7_APLKU|nr:ATP synthase F0 subunit 8 [Aplysia kurodai]AGT53692.1 ATP synthase F0 subunit 8 [Aplysia kurodai]
MPQLSPMMGILLFAVVLAFLLVLVISMKTTIPLMSSKEGQKSPNQKVRFF